MLDAVIILLVGAGILGGLFWWQNTCWGPKRKRALLHQEPMQSLVRWDFKATESAFAGELSGSAAVVPVAYVGYLHGYAVEVSFGWEQRPHFVVRVFFDPGSRGYERIMRSWQAEKILTQRWVAGECAFCAPIYVDAQLSYNFLPPKVEQLIGLAEQLIHLLQSITKEPIAYNTGCELATYVLASSKQKSLKSIPT